MGGGMQGGGGSLASVIAAAMGGGGPRKAMRLKLGSVEHDIPGILDIILLRRAL